MTSKKIRKVDATWRIHYPLWVTMAEANGTFEADPEIIHGKLYPTGFLPGITVESVRDALAQYIKAGLVVTWKQRGSRWGVFVGQGKAGMLPSESELRKYKHLPPNCPEQLLEKFKSDLGGVLRRFGYGLDMDMVRIGKEREEPSSSQNEFLEEEQDMSKFDPFVRIWQEKHGEAALCPYPRDSEKFKNKTIWKELISNHGMDLLLQAFTLWASEQAAEGQTERFPLEKFSRVAGDYMQLIKPLKTTLIRAEQQKNSEDKAAEEYRRLHSGITEQEDKPENTEDIF